MGYRIAHNRGQSNFGPQYFETGKHDNEISQSLQLTPRAGPTEPLDIDGIAQTFKIPPTTIGKIYTRVKEIEADLPKTPGKEFDASVFRNKIEDLEKTSIGTGAYVIPEITGLISHTKRRIHDLELASTLEIDPTGEVRNQIG